MKKVKISMVLNCLIFVLVVFGVIAMMTGLEFTGPNTLLTDTKVNVFKFFTVDSNIFAGVASLLLFIGEYLYLKKKKSIPRIISILKFMGTVSVVLTFMVTLFFLVPSSNAKMIEFYQNSNLFFHCIVPILCFISLILYDPIELSFKNTFLGIIPMFIYAIFYLISVFTHLDHGKVLWKYDFYGFLIMGTTSVFYVVPIIFIITYLIGLGIWACYKRLNK